MSGYVDAATLTSEEREALLNEIIAETERTSPGNNPKAKEQGRTESEATQ